MSDPSTQLFEKAYDFHKAGNLAEAERHYAPLFNMEPDNPLLLVMVAQLHQQKGQNAVAMALLEKAVGIEPDFRDAWLNLGVAFKAEQRPKEAKHCWERALALGESGELLSNFATLYADSGEPDKALDYADRALALEPDNVNTHWNRALALLSKARWAEAWDEHEYRLKLPHYKTRTLGGAPRWDGKYLDGTLCITGEQGLGDEIMFGTIIPEVISLARRVIIECTPKVLDVFSRSFAVSCYPSEGAVNEPVDAQIPLGSLAYLFRRTPESFPGTPCLSADPERVEHYRSRLGILGPRPWIGLSWVGGTKQTRVLERSVSLKMLAPIFERHTVTSLQYSRGAEEDAVKAGIPHWPEAVDDYRETSALVTALDCVVSVCTAVVHLSGALGAKCLVMTPKRSSWRYGMGETMPWYKSVRLYRQEQEGEWEPVIARINADLGQLQGHAAQAA